jgi:peptidoglycan/xylan/chitin deacetylase (PgdA/CDA1 family)
LYVCSLVHPLSYTLAQKPNVSASCNCVVFRIDDIQNYYASDAQIAAMNLFMSMGQPLSLGIIMNGTREDLEIIEEVAEGAKNGLFELGIHGWNHEDFTYLSESEQKSTLQMANEMMMKMFGNTSDIFVEPEERFNNDTIKVMEELEFRISSSIMSSENSFDGGRSIFNYTRSEIEDLSNDTKNGSSPNANTTIYHVPGMLAYTDYQNGKLVKVPMDKILSAVDDNIERYGYSVIVFHPEDFLQRDENDKVPKGSTVNSTEFQDFTRIVDIILAKLARNIRITTLSELVGIQPKVYS